MTKPRFLLPLLCAALGIFFIGLRLSHAQQEELDPLIVCKETQKLVFENQFVRVIENRSPAGHAEPKHSHGRGVTISLSDYDSETITYPSGKMTHGHTRFGEVRWAEPTVHQVRNVGTTEQHVIRVELK